MFSAWKSYIRCKSHLIVTIRGADSLLICLLMSSFEFEIALSSNLPFQKSRTNYSTYYILNFQHERQCGSVSEWLRGDQSGLQGPESGREAPIYKQKAPCQPGEETETLDGLQRLNGASWCPKATPHRFTCKETSCKETEAESLVSLKGTDEHLR